MSGRVDDPREVRAAVSPYQALRSSLRGAARIADLDHELVTPGTQP